MTSEYWPREIDLSKLPKEQTDVLEKVIRKTANDLGDLSSDDIQTLIDLLNKKGSLIIEGHRDGELVVKNKK